MCRNIRQLHNFEPPATRDEIHASALQYVRKISGVQKTVELRLLDDTLEKRLGSGIAVKSSFAVHTGKYVVRLVVRDSEGQLMAEQSSLVEIP